MSWWCSIPLGPVTACDKSCPMLEFETARGELVKSYAKRAPSFEIDQLAPAESLDRETPETLETSLDSETSQVSEEDSMAKPWWCLERTFANFLFPISEIYCELSTSKFKILMFSVYLYICKKYNLSLNVGHATLICTTCVGWKVSLR